MMSSAPSLRQCSLLRQVRAQFRKHVAKLASGSSQDTARAIVSAALRADSSDNCTALVLDVVDLETAQSAEIGASLAQLPLIPVPQGGETVDGFVLKVLLSEGRYSRLFGALDEIEGGEVALKFLKPERADENRRVQYFMFMQLIDVATSAVVWQNKATLTKAVLND